MAQKISRVCKFFSVEIAKCGILSEIKSIVGSVFLGASMLDVRLTVPKYGLNSVHFFLVM